jgi:hypothetical protein
VTRPFTVGGVGVYQTVASTTPFTGWLTSGNCVVKWNGTERDLLSGTSFYLVYVDGRAVPQRVYFDPSLTSRSLTLTGLSAGIHRVQVGAFDKAGNRSLPSTTVYAKVDMASPGVRVVSPASGATIGLKPELSAYATDAAGVASVQFKVDGVSVGKLTPSTQPRSYLAKLTADLSGFSSGTHTLSVKVTDVSGRTRTVTRSFKLDATPPRLTITSDGYSIFYPRLRDDYRDYFTVKFKSSESGTAKFVIKNSKGKVVRTITKSISSGYGKVSWNGKNSDGDVDDGTFYWTLRITDKAGNRSSTKSGSTKIRFYQIVKTSSDTVKVIPR